MFIWDASLEFEIHQCEFLICINISVVLESFCGFCESCQVNWNSNENDGNWSFDVRQNSFNQASRKKKILTILKRFLILRHMRCIKSGQEEIESQLIQSVEFEWFQLQKVFLEVHKFSPPKNIQNIGCQLKSPLRAQAFKIAKVSRLFSNILFK